MGRASQMKKDPKKKFHTIKKVIVFDLRESFCRTEQYAVNFGSNTLQIFRKEKKP